MAPRRRGGSLSYTVGVGGQELLRRSAASGDRILAGRIAAARDAAALRLGNDIRARSNAIAPLRTGALIRSAQVRPAGDGRVTIGYFGVPYARYQHENVHLRHPGGRQAKFLEKAVNDPVTARKGRQFLEQELKKRLGTGTAKRTGTIVGTGQKALVR